MSIEDKEQIAQSSESKEQTEESSKIGSMKDAMEKYEEQAKKSSEEKPEAKKEEKPSETPEEDVLWLVDKAGKKTPAVFKADGKEYRPKEVAKALQYMSLGVHGNVKTEEVNRKLAEIQKAEGFLTMIKEAHDQGRLVIDGKKIGVKEETKEEEEEDVFEDKELKKTKEELETLKKDVSQMKKHEMKTVVESYKAKMDKLIDDARKDNFAAVLRSDGDSPKEVWELLAEVDETTKHSKYTPEEAMKKSHESVVNFIKKIAETHPELLEDFSKDAVSKYLEDKDKKEVAPIGAPSSIPADVKSKPEEKKFKNLHDAMEKATSFFEEKSKATQKS